MTICGGSPIVALAGICLVGTFITEFTSNTATAAIFFPIVNGGHLILTTLSALVLFKEKLTVRQWIGIAVGIVSVVLLCNPF